MKKIFTLIAVAFVALSVNAKQAIDISGIAPDGKITFNSAWSWQGVSLSSGELIENSEAKTADDSGVTYFDASAYDYLIVKYSSATCDANVIAQLKCKGTIGQWGAEYYTSEGPVAKKKKGGYAFVKLDPNYKKYVNSVAFQNGNDAGEIIIDEVYWATEAEYQEALEASGQIIKRPAAGESIIIYDNDGDPLPFGTSWSVSPVIDKKYFEVAEVGDIIRCNITDASGANPVFKYIDWSDFTALQSIMVKKDNYFEATIPSEEVLTYLKANGLRLQGINFTLVNVELIARIAYEETPKNATISDGGFIAASEFDGFTDNAKVVFTYNVSGDISSYTNWGIGRVASNDATESDPPTVMVGELSASALGDLTFTCLISDIKKALAATPEGIAFTMWGFGDGVCVGSTVKVEIFEVAGASGIQSATVAKTTKSNAIYNLAGQKVNAQYKGVVIKNGKKVMQ